MCGQIKTAAQSAAAQTLELQDPNGVSKDNQSEVRAANIAKVNLAMESNNFVYREYKGVKVRQNIS